MNGFVSLVGAMAWPTSVLVMAVLFRREVRGALARLGRVKFRDLEVTFSGDLRQAESLASSLAPQAAVAPGGIVLEVGAAPAENLGGSTLIGLAPALTKDDRLERLAGKSPADAVLAAWGDVGRALLDSAARLGDRRATAPTRVEDAARFLADRGWMTADEARLVEQLRSLRGRAVEGDGPTADEARRYVALAKSAAARVSALG